MRPHGSPAFAGTQCCLPSDPKVRARDSEAGLDMLPEGIEALADALPDISFSRTPEIGL